MALAIASAAAAPPCWLSPVMNDRTLDRSFTCVSTLTAGMPWEMAWLTIGCSALGSVGAMTNALGLPASSCWAIGICVEGEYTDGSPCQMTVTPSALAAASAPRFMAMKNGSASAPMLNATVIFPPELEPVALVPVAPDEEDEELLQAASRARPRRAAFDLMARR